MAHQRCPSPDLSCRLWKTRVTQMWTNCLTKMLGSDHCGVCAPKEKLELSKLSLLVGPSPPWPARSKDSNLKFCVKMKKTFFWHWRNECIILWVFCDSQWEGQLTECCWRSQDLWRMTRSIPYSLTTSPFQHYIAQQRVDRANSYPPELEHLLSKNI